MIHGLVRLRHIPGGGSDFRLVAQRIEMKAGGGKWRGRLAARRMV